MKVVHPGKSGQAVGCDTGRTEQEITRMNVHKNARLMPQGRLLLVQRVLEQGWTVRSAAAAAGFAGCGLARRRPSGTLASKRQCRRPHDPEQPSW
jgi:hypothetical protein